MIYAIMWILSLFMLYYMMKLSSRKRIDELIDLVDKMGNRDYSIPMKQDEFSILEDKIYKIFIELVEEKEKNKIKSKNQIEYLEDIAHQIKTPISNMLFSIEILQESDSENNELFALKKQIQRLNSLSDILLKLSSLDSKFDDMKEEKFQIVELIEYAMDIVEIPEGIEIHLDSSLNEKIIKADFYWVSEAIINIFKNAINMPQCKKIRLKAESNPLYIALYLSDDAGGIKDGEFKKIFKRFYKSPDSKGFGIGLAMAKSIVEKNNGEIEVYNNQDGAEFKIKFYNVT